MWNLQSYIQNWGKKATYKGEYKINKEVQRK